MSNFYFLPDNQNVKEYNLKGEVYYKFNTDPYKVIDKKSIFNNPTYNINKNQLCFEIGPALTAFIKTDFIEKLHNIRVKFELPPIRIVDNQKLRPMEFRFLLYNRILLRKTIIDGKPSDILINSLLELINSNNYYINKWRGLFETLEEKLNRLFAIIISRNKIIVGLEYNRNEMETPVLILKENINKKIISDCKKCNIIIAYNKKLAEYIHFHTTINSIIPLETWKNVAEIFAKGMKSKTIGKARGLSL